jgi:hypothetical protein
MLGNSNSHDKNFLNKNNKNNFIRNLCYILFFFSNFSIILRLIILTGPTNISVILSAYLICQQRLIKTIYFSVKIMLFNSLNYSLADKSFKYNDYRNKFQFSQV